MLVQYCVFIYLFLFATWGMSVIWYVEMEVEMEK